MLDRMANYDHMWEVSEQVSSLFVLMLTTPEYSHPQCFVLWQGGWNHRYFLNLCTTSHINHACYTGDNEPLISYSCQIPSGRYTILNNLDEAII